MNAMSSEHKNLHLTLKIPLELLHELLQLEGSTATTTTFSQPLVFKGDSRDLTLLAACKQETEEPVDISEDAAADSGDNVVTEAPAGPTHTATGEDASAGQIVEGSSKQEGGKQEESSSTELEAAATDSDPVDPAPVDDTTPPPESSEIAEVSAEDASTSEPLAEQTSALAESSAEEDSQSAETVLKDAVIPEDKSVTDNSPPVVAATATLSDPTPPASTTSSRDSRDKKKKNAKLSKAKKSKSGGKTPLKTKTIPDSPPESPDTSSPDISASSEVISTEEGGTAAQDVPPSDSLSIEPQSASEVETPKMGDDSGSTSADTPAADTPPADAPPADAPPADAPPAEAAPSESGVNTSTEPDATAEPPLENALVIDAGTEAAVGEPIVVGNDEIVEPTITEGTGAPTDDAPAKATVADGPQSDLPAGEASIKEDANSDSGQNEVASDLTNTDVPVDELAEVPHDAKKVIEPCETVADSLESVVDNEEPEPTGQEEKELEVADGGAVETKDPPDAGTDKPVGPPDEPVILEVVITDSSVETEVTVAEGVRTASTTDASVEDAADPGVAQDVIVIREEAPHEEPTPEANLKEIVSEEIVLDEPVETEPAETVQKEPLTEKAVTEEAALEDSPAELSTSEDHEGGAGAEAPAVVPGEELLTGEVEGEATPEEFLDAVADQTPGDTPDATVAEVSVDSTADGLIVEPVTEEITVGVPDTEVVAEHPAETSVKESAIDPPSDTLADSGVEITPDDTPSPAPEPLPADAPTEETASKDPPTESSPEHTEGIVEDTAADTIAPGDPAVEETSVADLTPTESASAEPTTDATVPDEKLAEEPPKGDAAPGETAAPEPEASAADDVKDEAPEETSPSPVDVVKEDAPPEEAIKDVPMEEATTAAAGASAGESPKDLEQTATQESTPPTAVALPAENIPKEELPAAADPLVETADGGVIIVEESSGTPPSPKLDKDKKSRHRSSRHSTRPTKEIDNPEPNRPPPRRRASDSSSRPLWSFGTSPTTRSKPKRQESEMSVISSHSNEKKKKKDRTPEEQAEHERKKRERTPEEQIEYERKKADRRRVKEAEAAAAVTALAVVNMPASPSPALAEEQPKRSSTGHRHRRPSHTLSSHSQRNVKDEVKREKEKERIRDVERDEKREKRKSKAPSSGSPPPDATPDTARPPANRHSSHKHRTPEEQIAHDERKARKAAREKDRRAPEEAVEPVIEEPERRRVRRRSTATEELSVNKERKTTSFLSPFKKLIGVGS